MSVKPLMSQPAEEAASDREKCYTELMEASQGLANDKQLAQMIASWLSEQAVFPDYLGLAPDVYCQLIECYFPACEFLKQPPTKGLPVSERFTERQDLIQLLLSYRAGRDESELWIAEIVAIACMGEDHLWQDLGLWSRADLSTLMQYNFPALKALNEHDMKWKKFLYKQLCSQEGIYVCRAPSCEVCADYKDCFGPEE